MSVFKDVALGSLVDVQLQSQDKQFSLHFAYVRSALSVLCTVTVCLGPCLLDHMGF